MAIQFPSNPGIGSVFTDTDAGFSYEWTGVVWKSFTPAAANNIKELDDISSSFDGSEDTFSLTIGGVAYQPRSAAMLQVSLGDVIQEPTTDYTVAADTITFSSAPTGGTACFIVARGTAVSINYAADGNVQTKEEFTATEGQTSFTITGGYTAGYIDVFRNGVRLASDDITDTSGTAVVLATPAQAGDIIETIKYNVASLVVTSGQFHDINITGVITAATYNGDLTGDVTGNVSGTAGGLSGTPDITIGSLTASSGSISGNLSIGGTLTYQDVTNMDVLGIGTFQQGVQVLANGLDVTGISTLKSGLTVAGVATATGGFSGNLSGDVNAGIVTASDNQGNFMLDSMLFG